MQSIVMLNAFDKRRRVSPVTRVGQLSSSTSVYRPFELVYFVHVSDRDQAEGHVHHVLAASRVNMALGFGRRTRRRSQSRCSRSTTLRFTRCPYVSRSSAVARRYP